ncbi:MAG: FG-GAP repeat protein [Chitinophagaceae bacterium]
MKHAIILFTILLLWSNVILAQGVGISSDGSQPNASAQLDVKSTTKGVLIPRMASTERAAIVNPAPGLLVYDLNEKTLYMYDGSKWLGFSSLPDTRRVVTNFEQPDLADTSLTGYSVSIQDGFAAIGAPLKKNNGVKGAGGVYLYRNVGGLWQYFTTLLPPVNVTDGAFGIAVSLKGNYLAVGASGQLNNSNINSGAVYVYTYNGTTWTATQTLYGNAAGTNYGMSVSLTPSGSYLAVGESSANLSTVGAGAVNVYNKPGSSFVLQQIIQHFAPSNGDHFGTSVAINASGTRLIAGAPDWRYGGYYTVGQVAQFDRTGQVWTQSHTYKPPVVLTNGLQAGRSVDISENAAVFFVSELNELHRVNSDWSTDTVNIMPGRLYSAGIDPVTNENYAFSGNGVYNVSGNTITKIKALDIGPVGALPNLVSVYNKKYIVGLPSGIDADHPYLGGFYFGTDTH